MSIGVEPASILQFALICSMEASGERRATSVSIVASKMGMGPSVLPTVLLLATPLRLGLLISMAHFETFANSSSSNMFSNSCARVIWLFGENFGVKHRGTPSECCSPENLFCVEFCSVSTAPSMSVDFSQCPSFFPGAALQF
jgi:hypothetical protein